MIIGVGTDIIEIERVKKAAEKAAFLKKVYSERELEEYHRRCCRADFLAGGFAAKEAVVKAIGTGFAGFTSREVEILRRENGQPYVELSGRALEIAESLSIGNIHVSITDTAEYAAAFAVAERRA